jgi:hypothetical protein
MASGSRSSSGRADVRFEVDRIEARGGRLVVSGWWSGVRGMRFMRPTLLVRDRTVLATLDHKPWTPDGELEWTAAFPWDEEAPNLSEAALSVAPSVTVPLAPRAEPPSDAQPADAQPADAQPADAQPAAPPELPDEAPPPPDPRREEIVALTGHRDRLRAALAEAGRRESELESQLEEARRRARGLEAARDDAGRELTAAQRERDQALAQRDEAEADRDAAVRTRARMEAQRDEAVAARERAKHDRDEALVQRDEARAQREEALLAHRTLQRRFDAALAGGEEPPTLDAPSRPHADPDRPIGVRAIPAARAVAPDLHRAERDRTPHVSAYDVWAIRILGSIAALCFIGFLVLLLRLVL